MMPVLPLYILLDLTCETAGISHSFQSMLNRIRATAVKAEGPTRSVRLGVVGLGAMITQPLALSHLDSLPEAQLTHSRTPADYKSGFAYLADLTAHDVAFYKSKNLQVVRPLVLALLGPLFDPASAATAAMELHVAAYRPNVIAYGLPGVAAASLASVGSLGSYALESGSAQGVDPVLSHMERTVASTAERFASGNHTVAVPVDHPGLISIGMREPNG